eukprot:5531116-Prymnesium_polylepis.1
MLVGGRLLPLGTGHPGLVAAAAAAVGGAHAGSTAPCSVPPPAAPSRRISDAERGHASIATSAAATAGNERPLLPLGTGRPRLVAAAAAAVGGTHAGSAVPRSAPPPAAPPVVLTTPRGSMQAAPQLLPPQ